eukprot:SAG11_NODE_5194_length_1634_cov_1.381107_2_plen_285_part_00
MREQLYVGRTAEKCKNQYLKLNPKTRLAKCPGKREPETKPNTQDAAKEGRLVLRSPDVPKAYAVELPSGRLNSSAAIQTKEGADQADMCASTLDVDTILKQNRSKMTELATKVPDFVPSKSHRAIVQDAADAAANSVRKAAEEAEAVAEAQRLKSLGRTDAVTSDCLQRHSNERARPQPPRAIAAIADKNASVPLPLSTSDGAGGGRMMSVRGSCKVHKTLHKKKLKHTYCRPNQSHDMMPTPTPFAAALIGTTARRQRKPIARFEARPAEPYGRPRAAKDSRG